MSGNRHQTTAVLLPARCVQVGDRLRGQRVVSVEPGVGKAVQITTDDGRFVNFHMDENVRVHRVHGPHTTPPGSIYDEAEVETRGTPFKLASRPPGFVQPRKRRKWRSFFSTGGKWRYGS